MHSKARENTEAFVERIDDPLDRVDDQIMYLEMPRVKAQDFGGYPFIVIEEYTFNDTGRAVNGFARTLDLDIELHIYGKRDSAEDMDAVDEIMNQITYMVTGAEQVDLNTGAKLARLQFLRQNRMPGIDEADEPVIRQEVEVRGKLHIDMS